MLNLKTGIFVEKKNEGTEKKLVPVSTGEAIIGTMVIKTVAMM
jgi:hypothetical protein